MNVELTESLDAQTFTLVLLTDENLDPTAALLPAGVRRPTATEAEKEATLFYNDGTHNVLFLGLGKAADVTAEGIRRRLHTGILRANEAKKETAQVVFLASTGLRDKEAEYIAIALGETPALSNYQFKKYQKDNKPRSLHTVRVRTNITDAANLLRFGKRTADAACIARDLVNEPPNVIHALTLADAAKQLGQQYGFGVEVWEKHQIEQRGMGGLLAVNLGSFLPPTFTVMTYKPANAVNTKPVVLVGKGVTFDTGGLSLKPGDSMVGMKGDMGGAAAVICTLAAAASNQLPVYVIGLVPATDNRPGYNAYTPNDVIKMYDGTHVEVLNTDAEGRMILADALAYAKELDPAIVIDLATLTGAAVIAVGDIATAMYSTADDTATQRLEEAGHRTHERLVRLPLWDEYADQIKSDIADLKNVGGRAAGSITAAKFLQHFTAGAYPWVHLDIAGPAMLDAASAYRPKGGTGVGVRLLTEFLRRYSH